MNEETRKKMEIVLRKIMTCNWDASQDGKGDWNSAEEECRALLEMLIVYAINESNSKDANIS